MKKNCISVVNLQGKKVYILASATFVVTFFLMSDGKKHSTKGKVKLVCRFNADTFTVVIESES